MMDAKPVKQGAGMLEVPDKAGAYDFIGRFREIVSDPLNLLIERHPMAGVVQSNRVTLHNGLTVPVYGYFGDFSDILAINRGVHEPLEEYVFQETIPTLRPNPVSLELGSYWAHYSMWLKLKRPEAQVFMVEAQADYLAEGRRNFEINGLAGTFMHARVEPGGFEVDRFMDANEIAAIDVLHADIDLSEIDMLVGARRALANQSVETWFVSTHSQALHEQVRNTFREAGYRIEVDSDFDHDTTSFDGLVFATSPKRPPVFSNWRPLGRTEIALSAPTSLVAGLPSRASPFTRLLTLVSKVHRGRCR